ncbi:centromere-associated protein E-like [Scyliorhinus canicula]|uniref:centromere-associated protein E-like n=1 Tax=Scyliorhinus canicula TaxID=7830 RepID=UPI0018F59393|nr:centromere-associated protein E-like [Scyliorhinus canicula]
MAAPADEYINIGTEPSDESNSIQAPEGEDEAKVKSFNTKEIENLLESLKNTESILAEKEKAFQSTIDNLAEREKIFNLQEKELEYLKESMKNIQSNTIDSALAEKDKALIQKDIEIQKLTHSLKQAEKRISEQDKEIQQLNEIMKSSEKSSEQDKDIKSLKDILKISEMDQLRKSLKDTEDAFSEKERELNITKQALQKIQENLKQKEKDVIMPRRNYPSQSTASDVLRIQFINKIAQVKDLEKIRAKLESQLKEKTEELNKLQESESSMFEKQTELENRIKMSEKKIEIKDKEKMELTKLLQMTEKKLTDAKKDQDTKYRTDDERLIQLRAELQKLRETTRQQLLDKDSALNAALLSHQDKENRLSNKTAELAKVKSTLQTLEGKLNETAEGKVLETGIFKLFFVMNFGFTENIHFDQYYHSCGATLFP